MEEMIFDFTKLDFRQVMLNLRSFAELSAREVSDSTGISQSRLYRITGGGSYRLSDYEYHRLLDCHYDYCEKLHNKKLVIE